MPEQSIGAAVGAFLVACSSHAHASTPPALGGGAWRWGGRYTSPPLTTPCCPLAPEIWLCTWPEEGGPRLSASLRPGDPLPRPTHHRCLWRGQMQSVGRERAGSSYQKSESRHEGVSSER